MHKRVIKSAKTRPFETTIEQINNATKINDLTDKCGEDHDDPGWDNITQDIVLCHILPRVPAKSIVRFKCVSKGWHSFVTTPMFARTHLENHQNHHNLLFISNTSSPTFRTADCEALENGLTVPRHYPFKVDNPRHVSIITSCNGLVCVGIKDKRVESEYTRLMLWNPLTGEYNTLSKTNAHKECYEATYWSVFVLCYVSSEDDYRLLRVTEARNVYIYSLRSDWWRKVEPTEDFHRISRLFYSHTALLNDKLYALKQGGGCAFSIIRLDLKTEKCIEAVTPLSTNWRDFMGFTVLRGCIYVWIHNHVGAQRAFELWRMDGDGDWTKVVTFWETIACGRTWDLQPLHLMADGNWLMRHKQCVYKTDPVKPDKLFWSNTTTAFAFEDMGMDMPVGFYVRVR